MSISINEANLKLLSTLEGNETVGVDKEGRLFVKQTVIKTATIAQEILQGEQFTEVQKVVEEFLLDKAFELQATLHEKQKFTKLLNIFINNKLITLDQKNKIVKAWYDERLNDLLKDYTQDVATAIVVTEMSLDPHIAPEIRKKFSPISVNSEGLSGSYFLKNFEGEVIGIFKPQEQEFGMPLNPHGDDKPYNKDNPIEVQFYGHFQGTGWLKEVAASELSDDFMAVPYTTDFPILFPVPEKFAKEKGELCLQKGSFQKFAPNARTISEMTKKEIEAIPTEEIQKIALFDMLLVNGDRHLDNFLYDGKKIIPIDHGGCFLTRFDIRGEWLVMPQLKKPIDSKVLNWLNDFDIEASCTKLEKLGLDEDAIEAHKVMYYFLLHRMGKGENLFQIALKCVYNRDTEDDTPLQKAVSETNASVPDEFEEEEYFKNFIKVLDKL